MKKILNYILRGKGRGFLPLLTGSLLLSILFSLFVHAHMDMLLPLTAADLRPIVPITFENGVIVEPIDQLKKTTVKRDHIEYAIVLDTRADEIDRKELDQTGIYLSRRYFYVVDGQQINRQSFNDLSAVVDEANLEQSFEKVHFYAVVAIFIFTALGLFVFFLFMMLFLLITLLLMGVAKRLTWSARMRLNSLVVLWTSLVALLFLFTPINVPSSVYAIVAVLTQCGLAFAVLREKSENKD